MQGGGGVISDSYLQCLWRKHYDVQKRDGLIRELRPPFASFFSLSVKNQMNEDVEGLHALKLLWSGSPIVAGPSHCGFQE